MELTFYPNPSKGIFNYRINATDAYSFDVYDAVGNRVMKIVSNDEQGSIDLTQMVNGIYFVQLKTVGQTQMIRLLKN